MDGRIPKKAKDLRVGENLWTPTFNTTALIVDVSVRIDGRIRLKLRYSGSQVELFKLYDPEDDVFISD